MTLGKEALHLCWLPYEVNVEIYYINMSILFAMFAMIAYVTFSSLHGFYFRMPLNYMNLDVILRQQVHSI